MLNTNNSSIWPASSRFELRFQSLFHAGRALVLPCDAAGAVDMDTLSTQARDNYFYARSTIGRDFAMPAVQPSNLH